MVDDVTYNRVMTRFRGLCALHFDRAITLHHILPLSAGGTDDDENLLPVCAAGHDEITPRQRTLVDALKERRAFALRILDA